MRLFRLTAFIAGALFLSGALVGQEKKGDGKDTKKEDPVVKAKGQLPQGWGQIGLTDEQRQKVYKIQNKYNDEIEKLELKIKELKDKRDKERLDVLTDIQKKSLADYFKSKAGTGKADK